MINFTYLHPQLHYEIFSDLEYKTHTHTHTPFNGLLSGTPVGRDQKGKPIWILLKQETVSGSGISWAICKSAPRSRQTTTTPVPQNSVFYRPDALPAAQPTASKHWRQWIPLILGRNRISGKRRRRRRATVLARRVFWYVRRLINCGLRVGRRTSVRRYRPKHTWPVRNTIAVDRPGP